MKKLIMFFMVLAISVPVSATIDDPVPPMWGTAGTTGMWQLNDPCWSTPSCLLGTDYYSFVVPDAVWEDGVLYTSPTASETLWALIGISSGGSHVTVHVQIAASEDIEAADQTSLEIRSQAGAFIKEIFPKLVNAGDGIYTLTGTMSRPGGENLAAGCYIGGNDVALSGVIIDVLTHEGETPPIGSAREADCPKIVVYRSISIDPNVMTAYETGETKGDFGVSLVNEPPVGATITVTVDPNGDGNGWNEDIRLLGVDNPLDPNNTVTMTFNNGNWDVPQPVVFEAIDDDIPEPPDLLESQKILVSSSWPEHPTDANFVGEKIVTVKVEDNDQANILFELVGTGPIRETPVTLLEYQDCVTLYQGICYSGWITFPQTIGVTLQVKPENDESPGSQGYVRVIVEQDDSSGNPPTMTPPLLPQSPVEPNAIVFTSDGNPPPSGINGAVRQWDVPFDIVLLGVDDDQLQAEGAEEEGGQFYNAPLEFTVTHTTDARYRDDEGEGLVRTVDVEIEDNECGAYGILPMDIGNPNAATDPNYLDDEGNPLPDCHVDIYDVIEFATQWLDCSYMQDPSCESYL